MTEWREVDEPKIWVSRFFSSDDLICFDWTAKGQRINFVHAFRRDWALASAEDAPDKVFFERHKSVKPSVRDVFRIIGGVLLVSPALRDVLVQFDLGETQLFEVPIYADESGTPSGLPNHFALNVHAPKDTVIVELSEKVKLPIVSGHTKPEPNAKFVPVGQTEILAVRADAAQGADLWHDPKLLIRFFMSDRLKQAFDAAGLKVKALDL